MSTGFERRVKRLREHVLRHNKQSEYTKETLSIDDLKKDDIIKMLEEQEIEHNPSDKKEVLFDLLVGD